ncbi:hypothetical protein AUJ66_01100 [Candidatus Desantisbacteria bacterium CG1_02_38_46]|uniref:Amino acid ABC transporter substrate-binding protein n=3 Tax=unclassified Candidatus Desantisiibacteriota TaxID=3106372 RepID=A0A2H9PD95_9BACT|nr:MAG: hypothetical protein AUJ66_01100 [Candidatus Desantisbacteria bacterium CG1_02_38_46]PIU52146.1 MAG: amino acid ABC transporter substrate-binding protein [Candidatus Desantisbacteria bacterium CG07_land_8_20_14_0_80_39_15]PIZ17418.1 MAG: amino acid ABC transporter substrate-binding protein [Candidatus Desantisbacteria bacterium CG_4_10_14_0_8_um_filter_39_17]
MGRKIVGILILIGILFPSKYSFSQEIEGAAPPAGAEASLSYYGVAQLTKIRNSGEVCVGMQVGYKPFEFKNEKGEIIGFDVDIAKELAKALGAELIIKEYKWEDLTKNLGGEINLIISGMSRTLDRAFYVNFTNPYFQSGQLMIVNEKNIHLKDPYELNVKGRRIIVVGGTTGEDLANKKFKNAKIISVLNEQEAADKLNSDKGDAFLFDKPFIEYLGYSYSKWKVLPTQLTQEAYCFAIPKGDLDFLLWLNYFIEELKISGKYKEIYNKWFKY